MMNNSSGEGDTTDTSVLLLIHAAYRWQQQQQSGGWNRTYKSLGSIKGSAAPWGKWMNPQHNSRVISEKTKRNIKGIPLKRGGVKKLDNLRASWDVAGSARSQSAPPLVESYWSSCFTFQNGLSCCKNQTQVFKGGIEKCASEPSAAAFRQNVLTAWGTTLKTQCHSVTV